MRLNIFCLVISLFLLGCSIFGGKNESSKSSGGVVRMPKSQEWSFEGLPFVKSRTRGFFSHTEFLSGGKSVENKLVLKQRNGEYFWESRDNKKLVAKDGPRFLILQDPDGGEVIKIDKETGEFFEIFHKAMETTTIYGFQK